MTFSYYEVTIIRCDECDEQLDSWCNLDCENSIECEQEFYDSLQDQGWVWDREEVKHYCPGCAKRLGKQNDEVTK